MRSTLFILVLALSQVGCSPLKSTFKSSEVINDHFVGFALYDPVEDRFLYEYNSDKYFTPASNTKILTMFAALRFLSDSIVGLEYVESKDTLYFWGTGDPSFLNPDVHQSGKVYDFLHSSQKVLAYSDQNFYDQYFGPGWGWDDYNSYYSVEKSALPIYGNYVIVGNDSLSGDRYTKPDYFEKFLMIESPDSLKSPVVRNEENNIIKIYSPKTERLEKTLPFKTSGRLTTQLLEDTLKTPVIYMQKVKPAETQKIYSIPIDSLIKPMMVYSDNFIAEQLLLNSSGEVTDSLLSQLAIDSIQQSDFAELPDKLNWVDGSGLSRYNLFTPRSVVMVWNKLFTSINFNRLQSLLATGGESGTIRNLYASENAFIWAKTGSLRNNHSLSGFVITDSGRVLIFSYMNSNYTLPSSLIKGEMDRVLRLIKSKY